MEDKDEASNATEGEQNSPLSSSRPLLDDVNAHKKVENDKEIANKEEEESEDKETDQTTLQIEKERKMAESILDN